MFINSERVSWARELSLEGVHNLAKRSTWKFGQVNEVFLMEKINCMHLAREKLTNHDEFF